MPSQALQPDVVGPALEALALIHAGNLPSMLPQAFYIIDE